jgi:diadenylate cyclase
MDAMSKLLSAAEWPDLSTVAQIAILAVAIYAILKRARGSRFGQALLGVVFLAVLLMLFTFVLHFDVLSVILKSLLAYLAISTVVIFQPEIRRMLSQFGAFGSLERRRFQASGAATPEYAAETILHLSKQRTGALLAFERGISLRSYEETGVPLHADLTCELLSCILTPPLPLHDGGITVRDGRLVAAHCVFPVSNSPSLVTSGMRHRAAVGLSEDTDAIVVVVSEESGNVSVAHNGRLIRLGRGGDASDSLVRWVSKALDRERRGNRWLAPIQALFTKKGTKKK